MLWKRTVSKRQFFWTYKIYDKKICSILCSYYLYIWTYGWILLKPGNRKNVVVLLSVDNICFGTNNSIWFPQHRGCRLFFGWFNCLRFAQKNWLHGCHECALYVERSLSKIGFQDQLSLNAGQKYCRMLQGEHSAILLTCIKLQFVIKIFVLSIFEWLLKTGFAVFHPQGQ